MPASGTSAVSDGKALLNLGCGADHNPAFVNVDLVASPGVIGHDLRQGIPFPDGTYDLVYNSTMLSHFRPADALAFMRECHRVLKPGGVLRVVTEDLEQMSRVYLQKLEAACGGDLQSGYDHEWMLLELYDQATREYPGGEMAKYVRQAPVPNPAFIISRFGEIGGKMVSKRPPTSQAVTRNAAARPPLLRLVAGRARRLILRAMLGSDGLAALEVGRFRLSSGQVSYRMYDRYSLEQLFLAAGFSKVSVRNATESGYALWETVNLDLSSDGRVARPHALILEGIR